MEMERRRQLYAELRLRPPPRESRYSGIEVLYGDKETQTQVLVARRTTDGERVAIKTFRIARDKIDEALNEAFVLRSMAGHPHVVRMLDVILSADNSRVAMEFEYANATMHEDVLRLTPRLPGLPTAGGESGGGGGGMLTAYRIAATEQVLSAVEYLHSVDVVHCDIKASNILVFYPRAAPVAARGVTELPVFKLADFGVARLLGPARRIEATHDINPTGCRPPEVLLLMPLGPEIDMWAVGCTLAWMLDPYRCPLKFFSDRPALSGKPVPISAQEEICHIDRILGPIPASMRLRPIRHTPLQFEARVYVPAPPSPAEELLYGFDTHFRHIPAAYRPLLRSLLQCDPGMRYAGRLPLSPRSPGNTLVPSPDTAALLRELLEENPQSKTRK